MTVPKTTSANTKGDDMDERRDPEDLSALVTGATSGIGRQPQTSLINHTLRVHGVPTPGCGGDGQP